ncbi:MAG: hypothetical protein LBV15_00045 [Planctomycetota bacterium]|nr:hypothetical protein [Planctomycetota bacterium]
MGKEPPLLPAAPPPGAAWSFPAELSWYVFSGSLLLLLLVAAAVLRDSLVRAGRPLRLEDGQWGEAPAAADRRLETTLDEADRLAGEGDFAGAMHALLLRSLEELRRRLDLSLAASLTSREILRRVSLDSDGRLAFGDIVGRVEKSHFGSHWPGAEEYRDCRRSYEALVLALRREPAG